MLLTQHDIDFSTATRVTHPTLDVGRSDHASANGSITNCTNISELIDYYDYCERVHDELIEEQQVLAESLSSATSDAVSETSSAVVGDLDFFQFKSRANVVRKTVRLTAPSKLIQSILGLKSTGIELIDSLEAEIRSTSDKLKKLEDKVLSLHPHDSGEANAKLGFLCLLLLNGRDLDPDQIAFVLAECLEKRS